MSTLTSSEESFFEDLFDMRGGYVLDLSNERFEHLFLKAASININDYKYKTYGESKAKRLRAFWKLEADQIVGKILSELLELWWYKIGTKLDKENEKKNGEGIIQKLLGAEIRKEESEYEFLEKKFKISIDKLKMNHKMTSIISERLTEAQRCLQFDASLSVIFFKLSVQQ